MPNEIFKQQPENENSKRLQFEGRKNVIFQTGNIDSEKTALRLITDDLEAKKITIDEALQKLDRIEQGRQDYH